MCRSGQGKRYTIEDVSALNYDCGEVPLVLIVAALLLAVSPAGAQTVTPRKNLFGVELLGRGGYGSLVYERYLKPRMTATSSGRASCGVDDSSAHRFATIRLAILNQFCAFCGPGAFVSASNPCLIGGLEGQPRVVFIRGFSLAVAGEVMHADAE
jgi:hypothetical protein